MNQLSQFTKNLYVGGGGAATDEPIQDDTLYWWMDAADDAQASTPGGILTIANKASGAAAAGGNAVESVAGDWDRNTTVNGNKSVTNVATSGSGKNFAISNMQSSWTSLVMYLVIENTQGSGTMNGFRIPSATIRTWSWQSSEFRYFAGSNLYLKGSANSNLVLIRAESGKTSPAERQFWNTTEAYTSTSNLTSFGQSTIQLGYFGTGTMGTFSICEFLLYDNPSWELTDSQDDHNITYLQDKWGSFGL